MYVDGSCFDPSTIQEDEFSHSIPNCNPNPNFSIEDDLSNYHQNPSQVDEAAAMEMELQHHLGINTNLCYDNNTDNTQHFIQETNNDIPYNQALPYDQDQSNWVHEMSYNTISPQNPNHPNFINNPSLPPDLLNLFNLPRCSTNFHTTFGDMSSTVTDNGSAMNLVYDPILPLSLPPHPPLFRDLFQSLPQGYALPGLRTGSLLGGLDEREGDGGVFENGDGRSFDSGVLEFTRDINCLVKKRSNRKGAVKHFATEKHRREQFNDKYNSLKELLPSPTKPDRASIVGDAINYIQELLREVSELKILVDKKRCGRARSKRKKMEQDGGDVESCVVKSEADDLYNNNGGSSSLRCSWLQRKSKETEVDVRIIDDEVTIKLSQRKKINCLLIVSKVLDELQLDIHHVAGGLVGDNFSFLFNTKICEGSCVYASAIANKLIEVVDRQYAAIQPTSSF